MQGSYIEIFYNANYFEALIIARICQGIYPWLLSSLSVLPLSHSE